MKQIDKVVNKTVRVGGVVNRVDEDGRVYKNLLVEIQFVEHLVD